MDNAIQILQAQWAAHWPAALAAWSRYTRLSEPRWCLSNPEAKREGLTESFAMIRLNDQAVVVNLAEIKRLGLGQFAEEILAHEIGHHVYCPADLSDNARMIARLRRGLPGVERLAPMVGNLYTDLLINDRLQRSARLRMADIYRRLADAAGAAKTPDRLWTFYMRTYEILWGIQRGSLATGFAGFSAWAAKATPAEVAARTESETQIEGDAQLAARVIRVYARDWLRGASRFALLALPYLLNDGDQTTEKILKPWRDTDAAGAGALPDGLTEIDEDEIGEIVHPANDPEITGIDEAGGDDHVGTAEPEPTTAGQPSAGQHRQPYEYGQILKQLGITLTDHEISVRYYRERAMPHLIPFPSRILPESTEPLPEGLEAWDIGSPIENADWVQSVIYSPNVIPGMTTLQRVWGTTQGAQPSKEPLDLDLYVDCSGSMPNPQVAVSYLTLAGAIIALSALRAGGRVQATLWSGTRQYRMTDGFVRDADDVLRILTGYFGGGTAFPIHILRDTYAKRRKTDRPVRILVISDEGVTTMFDKDEKGASGWDISAMAVRNARGGATMALNLNNPKWGTAADKDSRALQRARDEQGWGIFAVRSWEDLLVFARAFSRETFG